MVVVPTSAQTPTATRPRGRDGARRRPARRDPAATRTREPRHHEHLPAGHRQQRDHQHRPRPAIADDFCQRRPHDQSVERSAIGSASASGPTRRHPRLATRGSLVPPGATPAFPETRNACCYRQAGASSEKYERADRSRREAPMSSGGSLGPQPMRQAHGFETAQRRGRGSILGRSRPVQAQSRRGAAYGALRASPRDDRPDFRRGVPCRLISWCGLTARGVCCGGVRQRRGEDRRCRGLAGRGSCGGRRCLRGVV